MPEEQSTNSQPPNDPMGIGGEERKPGYGKYASDAAYDSQQEAGAPGAFGGPKDKRGATARPPRLIR